MKQRTLRPGMPLVAMSSEQTTPHKVENDVGRSMVLLNINLIDPNPLAPREVYTAEMILERAEALRTQGQHDPIHVMPSQNNSERFIIVDGWTRVLACKDHGVLQELLAEVHSEMTVTEAAWFGYQQNEERQEHCDLDRAFFYEKLIEMGESANEIARRAKISKSLMSFYRSYSKLPPEILDIIRQKPQKFSANITFQLNKLFEAKGLRQTLLLANKFADEDQTVRWLANQVQIHLEPAHNKSSSPSKHIRYGNGFYKQRGDLFEVSIEVPDEKKQAFATALEALLDTVSDQTTKDET